MANGKALIAVGILVLGSRLSAASPNDCVAVLRAEGMVAVRELEPSIRVELKYSSTDNFLNADVYGDLEDAFLRREAAEKLANAARLLAAQHSGLVLLVYDAFRPRGVQRRMWEIVRGTALAPYVADPARGSVHNYGCAVDLTLARFHADGSAVPLDMGSAFDHFGEQSRPDREEYFLKRGVLSAEQVSNRRILRDVMRAAGFRAIMSEWWHFEAMSWTEAARRYRMVDCGALP
jgi:zinc D-Ala-D-Ala dipeptidase